MPDRTSRQTMAAAIVIQALTRKNDQTAEQLRTKLDARGLETVRVSQAIRKIRDLYGAHALVQSGTRSGRRAPIYTLNPEAKEAAKWARQIMRRALTEARHVEHVLDWAATTYGNRGAVRRARRYQANVVAEIEEVLEALNGSA